MASAAVASTTSPSSAATTVTVSASARRSPGQASGGSGGSGTVVSKGGLMESIYDSTNGIAGKGSQESQITGGSFQESQGYKHDQQPFPGRASADSFPNENGPAVRQDGGDGETPLPKVLIRILEEVARTGTSSLLSWDQETNDPPTGGTEAGGTAASSLEASFSKRAGVASTSTPRADADASSRLGGRPPAATAGPSHQTLGGGSGRPAGPPPRKKRRNGIQWGGSPLRMRFGNPDGASDRASVGSGGRKRPLLSAPGGGTLSSAPSSVGSGRTSGSEPEDSTQYECDSEGTSATTNSEVSSERLRKSSQRAAAHVSGWVPQRGTTESVPPPGGGDNPREGVPYRTLKGAFREALGLVLDHFYHNRGGYALSPAEKLRNRALDDSDGGTFSETLLPGHGGRGAMDDGNKKRIPLSPEAVFQQRRQRLMVMLLPASMYADNISRRLNLATSGGDPPFTIQRIAEVLVSPERYYTQTHKLCNCLEKLLLVTSPTGAFGGITGGNTSQSRREERELTALADEKERQEYRLRQKRFRRRTSSPTDEITEASDGGKTPGSTTRGNDYVTLRENFVKLEPAEKVLHATMALTDTVESQREGKDTNRSPSARQKLEAAARASLRSKFDHVGIDHGSIDPRHLSTGLDVRAVAENRGMTNSPPPPSLAVSTAPSNVTLPSHSGVSGFVRQHPLEQHLESHSIARIPSPILLSHGNESHIHTTAANLHILQLHHAASLANAAMSRTNTAPLDLMSINAGTVLQMMPQANNHGGSESQELEADHGRSSASNSDVDSESDDVSFDDSASDRSDGSDSGSATHSEPFTAARAMALNRMQQQQRLQSRVLTSLGSSHQSEGYRPPADSEYQSGDSIDSTRAEDSGGSDSSSSDLAD